MIDLTSHFKHLHWRQMPHSMGVKVASEWADKADDDPIFGIYKNCGLFTRDEADILYRCAKQVAPGFGLDIGAHTGWTTAHVAAAGLDVVAVDPMLRLQAFQHRFEENMSPWWGRVASVSYQTSEEYFRVFGEMPDRVGTKFILVCVDGDHSPGKPLEDAKNAAAHLKPDGVILLHDGIGQPVREAVTWLMDQGFHARAYWTPHLLFCCWRGHFTPPSHEPDRTIDWTPHVREMSQDFDFSRLR